MGRSRVERLGLLGVLGALALAGCGSSGHSAPSTATGNAPGATTSAPRTTTTTTDAQGNVDTCSVVTRAEAASALEEPVSPGMEGKATVEGGRACVFFGPTAPHPRNPNVAQPDTVRVVIVKGPRAAQYYRDYRSKVHAVPLAGYGGQAFFDGYASLSVIKGDAYLRVAVVRPNSQVSLADEENLAGHVLPHL
jgi:hypothetical protein